MNEYCRFHGEERVKYSCDLPERAKRALLQMLGVDTAPDLFHLGRAEILENELTAFFCSVRCPGNLASKTYDLAQRFRAQNQSLIGGFHSPVEREVLNVMLCSPTPVCIVLARNLPERIPGEFRRPLDEGRLLLLSPFDAEMKRTTKESAIYRNQIVAALAGRIFVAFAAPGSKTEAFCRSLSTSGKECLTFDDPKTENLRAAGFAAFQF